MRNLILIILVSISTQLLGGELFSEYNFRYSYKRTFLLPHSGAVNVLTNGAFGIYELEIDFPKWGNQDFHSKFPLNNWGIAINYSPLSNKELLGFGIGLMPYINIVPFNKRSWEFRLGTGLGFVEKPFNNISNPKNMVIGSYINNTTDLSVRFRGITFTKGYGAKIGLGIQHFSNGAVLRPNLGLNLPYISLVIGHKTDSINKIERTIKEEESNYFINASYGPKTLDFAATFWYNVVQLGGGYSFGFKKGKLLHVQADFIFDESVPYLKDYPFELSNYSKWIVGVFATYEKKYGQVGFLIGTGLYLHSPYRSLNQDWSYANKGGNLYNRVGVKYYFNEKINTQIMVRSHTGEADNIEVGVGYRF